MSPSPKSAPSAVVGLDIGNDSIKVAEAKIAKDGITITGLGIARTPQGVIENEVIVDPKALGAAVKTLLNECGIKTKKCVSSVSGASQVVVRVISVPKMKKEELAETMKWEVERHVPFSPTEVVMDFQPLDLPGNDPNATEMEVLLAVAQQQLIDSHVEMLFAAGLQPMAIDIEPLAVSRSLIELSRDGAMSETSAVVNIGATHTDLGIFENGILTFPSPPIAVAGINFTKEIAEALGQTLEQAEITKREFAAVNLDGFATTQSDDGDAQVSASADEPTISEPTISEPTAFDTSFGPGMGTPSSFDLDAPEAAEEEDVLAAEPASLSDFMTTDDGPVFDTPATTDGPSFDIGEAAAPSGPSFDLGEPAASSASTFDLDGSAEPEPSGPSFDLGEPAASAASISDLSGDNAVTPGPSIDLGGETAAPVSPTFDLTDDEPEAVEEVSEPSFDLSDAGEEADHGKMAKPKIRTTNSKPIDFSDGSTESQVFQAISGVLVDLANELRMSLDYYTNRYSKTPERLYLCGGMAKMPKLDEFLSDELGIPVEVADPVRNLSVNVPAASPQYLDEISPLLPICVGLAIRDMIG